MLFNRAVLDFLTAGGRRPLDAAQSRVDDRLGHPARRRESVNGAR